MLVNVAAVLLQYCARLSYSEEFSPKLIEYSAFMASLISSTGRSLRGKAWFIENIVSYLCRKMHIYI